MSKPADAIRVLIVDDSAVIRGALGRIVDDQPDMTVVTTAPNGRVALDALSHMSVDVVLLDIEMPEMDGLSALPVILSRYPATRVIMASSLTQKGAEVTMQALALGAADYIAKPAAKNGSAALASLAVEIASKVRAIGRAARGNPTYRATRGQAQAPAPVPVRTALLASTSGDPVPRVLAIASSTGGPNALAEVLAGLPNDYPLPILITQHMPPLFTTLLAQRLTRDANRECVEATNGEFIRPGCTYVARGDFHMTVQTLEGKPFLRLTQAPPEHFCRPAADPMLRSIASIYGASTLAVVLTGMGEDGQRGCDEVQRRGGRVIVQDEASSVVWGMPGAVANAGLANWILPLSDIAAKITHLCGVAAT
jgi:two-component system chemotaxis response regulator CheB